MSAYEKLGALLAAYPEHDRRLDIWRRYPDISEEENDFTDYYACKTICEEFAAFAREKGWKAVIIAAEGAKHPHADYHYWVRLTPPWTDAAIADVDWTARQFHNLEVPEGHDPVVLNRPWPLIWNPELWGDEHPLAGEFRTVRHIEEEA